MDHEKFAACVKKARTEKKMTQKELAASLHISDKAVSKWERGLSFPDIELLGPLSQELDIPLSVLLDVEDLAAAAGSASDQGFENLLTELLALMKERVREEFRNKKRVLCILTGILAMLIMLAAGVVSWTAYTNIKRSEVYQESIHIFAEEDIEIVSLEEKDGTVFLSLCIQDNAAFHYDVFERHWYDKDDPTIACMQFYCYEKEYMMFDSMEEYNDHRAQNGVLSQENIKLYVETGTQRYKQDQIDGYTSFVSAVAIEQNLLDRDPDLPVTKIVYCGNEDDADPQRLVLWEEEEK